MKLEIHPLAELIPAMTQEEFADLREDIQANGQREAVTLYQGKVLDGRHRARACEELNIIPSIRDYTGDEPAAYVLSLNVKRRSLSKAQLATVAVDFLPELEKEAKARQGARTDLTSESTDTEVPERKNSRSYREAAEAVGGISEALVGRAKRVKAADPEEFERLRRDETTVNAAVEKIAKPIGAREAKRSTVRLENLVHTLTNTQTLLRETNVEAVVQTVEPKEATRWASQLRGVRTDLSRLITALESRS